MIPPVLVILVVAVGLAVGSALTYATTKLLLRRRITKDSNWPGTSKQPGDIERQTLPNSNDHRSPAIHMMSGAPPPQGHLQPPPTIPWSIEPSPSHTNLQHMQKGELPTPTNMESKWSPTTAGESEFVDVPLREDDDEKKAEARKKRATDEALAKMEGRW